MLRNNVRTTKKDIEGIILGKTFNQLEEIQWSLIEYFSKNTEGKTIVNFEQRVDCEESDKNGQVDKFQLSVRTKRFEKFNCIYLVNVLVERSRKLEYEIKVLKVEVE